MDFKKYKKEVKTASLISVFNYLVHSLSVKQRDAKSYFIISLLKLLEICYVVSYVQ